MAPQHAVEVTYGSARSKTKSAFDRHVSHEPRNIGLESSSFYELAHPSLQLETGFEMLKLGHNETSSHHSGGVG